MDFPGSSYKASLSIYAKKKKDFPGSSYIPALFLPQLLMIESRTYHKNGVIQHDTSTIYKFFNNITKVYKFQLSSSPRY
jgi:hypothetical protein